jgi:hypothetical protein
MWNNISDFFVFNLNTINLIGILYRYLYKMLNLDKNQNNLYNNFIRFRNESVVDIENIKVIVLPTTNLTNSSSIFDPNSIDTKITLVSIDKFIPEQNVIEKCSLNDNYCIKVDNYPR